VNGIKEKIETVKGYFRDLYHAVVGGSYVPDMVTDIQEWMSLLGGPAMVDPAKSATAETEGLFTEMAAVTTEQTETATDIIGRMWGDVFGQLRDGIADSIVGLIEGSQTLGDVWKNIAHQILQTIVQALLQATLFSKKNMEAFIGDATNMFSNMVSNISGGLAGLAAQVMGVMGLFSKDGKKRKKSWLGGLVGGLIGAFTGGNILTSFLYGSAGGQMLFHNPINDTAAVRAGSRSAQLNRSNADFARLMSQGADSRRIRRRGGQMSALLNTLAGMGRDPGAMFPAASGVTRPGSSVSNSQNVTVSTRIDKVNGIDDITKISEQQAWIISKRLQLVPTS
jgi:hypothetical protein